jgi:hypothetical protein
MSPDSHCLESLGQTIFLKCLSSNSLESTMKTNPIAKTQAGTFFLVCRFKSLARCSSRLPRLGDFLSMVSTPLTPFEVKDICSRECK